MAAIASLLDVCRFNPTLGGTTDWTYSAAITGYQSPTAAGAINGALYSYRAESADLSQWEIGMGAYNSSTGVFARTSVLFNSAGTTVKINFTSAPQVAIVALAENLQSKTSVVVTGLDNTGATDVGAALNAIIQAAPLYSTVILPQGAYLTSVTILVNGGRELCGMGGGLSPGDLTLGTCIIGTLSLNPIVDLFGDSGSLGVNLKRIHITRAAGTIPASVVGLRVFEVNNGVIEDVFIARQNVGIDFLDLNCTVHVNRLTTFAVTGFHWSVQGSSIEIYFDNCRAGINGAFDTTCTGFLYMGFGGWDTVRFKDCQWNQGQNPPAFGIYFDQYNASDPNGIMMFSGLYCEGVTSAFMVGNACTQPISRISMTGCAFNSPSIPFCGTAALVRMLLVSSCKIIMNLTVDQLHYSNFVGNAIDDAFVLNAATYCSFVGNTLFGSITLQGACTGSKFTYNPTASSITNTSTGMTVI